MEHLSSLTDWTPEIMMEVLELAARLKADPSAYSQAAARKVLFMIFEKPSLRTRVSFETGIVRMGGHAINYDVTTSPLGAGKESLPDTIKVVSRYADLIVARLFKHGDLTEMIANAGVPVINGLTDYSHPCQILADLLTIREHKGELEGKTLCFLGDGFNKARGNSVIAYVRNFLDQTIPLADGSWKDITNLKIVDGALCVSHQTGETALLDTAKFAGHTGEADAP
ncbi:MAG: ornithine carbamoyltransferase, partial [Kiritimatiellia bacterium]